MLVCMYVDVANNTVERIIVNSGWNFYDIDYIMPIVKVCFIKFIWYLNVVEVLKCIEYRMLTIRVNFMFILDVNLSKMTEIKKSTK